MDTTSETTGPIPSDVRVARHDRERRTAAIIRWICLLATDGCSFLFPYFLYRVDQVKAPIILYYSDNMGIGSRHTGFDWYVVLVSCTLLLLVLIDFYNQQRSIWDEIRLLMRTVFFVAAIDLAILYMAGYKGSFFLIVLNWLIVALLLPSLRFICKRILTSFGYWQIPTLVISSGHNADQIWQALQKRPIIGYDIKALILLQDEQGKSSVPALSYNEKTFSLSYQEAVGLAQRSGMHVIVVPSDDNKELFRRLINYLAIGPNSLDVVPPLRGLPLYGTDVIHLFGEEILLLRVRNNLARRGPRILKRIFDITAAALLLLLLAPVFAFIAWRIKSEDGGAVFFTQTRVGMNGHSFPCYKFRSMANNAEEVLSDWKQTKPELFAQYQNGNFKLKDDPRVTRIGKVIRTYSLDELPQLYNVLLGHMALIGPRPLLAREIEKYGEGIIHYYRTLPGITGLWQVSGRSETSFADRAFYDEWYIQNWSMWLDIVILLKTIHVVFGRNGAY